MSRGAAGSRSHGLVAPDGLGTKSLVTWSCPGVTVPTRAALWEKPLKLGERKCPFGPFWPFLALFGPFLLSPSPAAANQRSRAGPVARRAARGPGGDVGGEGTQRYSQCPPGSTRAPLRRGSGAGVRPRVAGWLWALVAEVTLPKSQFSSKNLSESSPLASWPPCPSCCAPRWDCAACAPPVGGGVCVCIYKYI